MSLWEFFAIQRGFRQFNSPDESAGPSAPSNEEFDDVVARVLGG